MGTCWTDVKEANASSLSASLGMPAELLEGEGPPRTAQDVAQQRGCAGELRKLVSKVSCDSTPQSLQ